MGVHFYDRRKMRSELLPTISSPENTHRENTLLPLSYSTNRINIILLTTHFMDEADYLGDKIAIMS